MNTAIYNANNLPEYIIGDSIHENPDQLWLVRLHAPRFVGRIDDHADGHQTITQIEWIDPAPQHPADCAALMSHAGDWVDEEFELQNLK